MNVGTREEWLDTRVRCSPRTRTEKGRDGEPEGWPRRHDEYE